jgi:hypothetical protein
MANETFGHVASGTIPSFNSNTIRWLKKWLKWKWKWTWFKWKWRFWWAIGVLFGA